MKKINIYIGIALTALILSSCAITTPLVVTNNPSKKVGEASMNVWLGFIRPLDGDLSIKTAAKNGDITKIATVDIYTRHGLFKTSYKTIVTGE